MRISKTLCTLLALPLLSAAAAFAQAPASAAPAVIAPSPGCSATPAQLEANKAVAMAFFRPGISGADRVALADTTYKQHNPEFVKGAKEAGMNDYDYFKSRFGGPPAAARAGGPAQGGRGAAAGPPPPAGNPYEVVTAECDVVTIVHKGYRQDPTAAPGTFYEVFTFDSFRVRNGKLVEHWDGAVINPPAPAGGRGN